MDHQRRVGDAGVDCAGCYVGSVVYRSDYPRYQGHYNGCGSDMEMAFVSVNDIWALFFRHYLACIAGVLIPIITL